MGEELHASSIENMRRFIDRYLGRKRARAARPLRVVDVGSADVNGSYRSLFPQPEFDYVGVDLAAGPGVDLVLANPYSFPFADGSADLVVSGQAFERCPRFWELFREMLRVLHPDGYLFLSAPSSGPLHRYPEDCYRFLPDAFRSLSRESGCQLLELRTDERGPWHDLVGVFRHSSAAADAPESGGLEEVGGAESGSSSVSFDQLDDAAETEREQGESPYLDVLGRIHAELRPDLYLEIGVRRGNSLRLATCRSVGVDPAPDLASEPAPGVRIIEATSDRFFSGVADQVLTEDVDLAFIDGDHRIEFALRDFMHVERRCGPASLVVVDDIFPNHPLQADRKRTTRHWTGEVWKLHELLRAERPDLVLLPLDTAPSGMLLVAGLDATDTQLWESYDTLLRDNLEPRHPPGQVLDRAGALSPGDPRVTSLLRLLARAKENRLDRHQVRAALERWRAAASGARSTTRAPRPLLSVVVVAHDMARELPRTLRSLSPGYQRGVAEQDFEVVVVDNGSSTPVDLGSGEGSPGNFRLLRVQNAKVSPAEAINLGIETARGDLVCAMIDGARLASPGLVANALRGSRLHPRAVIATLGFHLGHKVQMESVHEGYDTLTEDTLLASSGWLDDGYALFGISTFAGSSAGGWFQAIAESNALTLDRTLWDELGGFDEAFVSRGGGLVNLDLYERACGLTDSQVVILLGEGTFHQVHGGAATNARDQPWREFHAEYETLRGRPFRAPAVEPWYIGSPAPQALPSIARSVGLHSAVSAPRLTAGQQERAWRCGVDPHALSTIQSGTLRTRYRGRELLKSPFDQVLYQQLIDRLRPRTVIEIGTKEGGSALWFADQLSARGEPALVVSVDREAPPSFSDSRIVWRTGDARSLAGPLPAGFLSQLEHPWLVVEDADHLYETCLAVLRFFDPHLHHGDYIVIEDGVVAFLPDDLYRRYENGPNRALETFLSERGDAYEIVAELCDYFGANVTNNPNGWLRRL